MGYREVIASVMNKMFIGTCDVIIYAPYTDPSTKKTHYSEQVLSTGNPCRLSHNSNPSTGEGTVSRESQGITLFLPPTVNVPVGSKLIVTQRGVMKAYKNSSEPKLYAEHQEIELELFDKWA